MKIEFDAALPIYSQIVEGIKKEICSGSLSPGEKIMPVREFALYLGVNPNTLQRAMSELEREGFLNTERTSGRFVTTDDNLISKARSEMITGIIDSFLDEMTSLGCDKKEIIEIIERREARK